MTVYCCTSIRVPRRKINLKNSINWNTPTQIQNRALKHDSWKKKKKRAFLIKWGIRVIWSSVLGKARLLAAIRSRHPKRIIALVVENEVSVILHHQSDSSSTTSIRWGRPEWIVLYVIHHQIIVALEYNTHIKSDKKIFSIWVIKNITSTMFYVVVC